MRLDREDENDFAVQFWDESKIFKELVCKKINNTIQRGWIANTIAILGERFTVPFLLGKQREIYAKIKSIFFIRDRIVKRETTLRGTFPV